MNAPDLLALLLAPGAFLSWDTDPVDVRPDPSYAADLAEARRKTGLDESVITGEGLLAGRRVAVAASEFGFLGGSIGVAAGERLTRAVERATAERLPLICLPASGGTRMQEGTIAFLQMVKITAAVAAHKSAHLPYLVYLRHPTTGGVFASWGSLGHLTLAEPGALIGFLGPRVYQALYGSRFPDGIQTAENLHAHGLIDALVTPADLAAVLHRILVALIPKPGTPSHPDPTPLPAQPTSAVRSDSAPITAQTHSAVQPGPATTTAEPPGAVRPDPAAVTARPGTAASPDPATITAGPRSNEWLDPATMAALEPASAWESVLRTRRADRPGAADLIRLAATDVTRLDREGLIMALARIGGYPCVLIAHDRDGPPPGPVALRLARRGVRLAAGLRLPLVSVIDTAGAGYSPAAEHDGLASQIAHCLAELTTVPVPTVSLLLGQGAGGAALALLPADRVLAAQHAWLAPLPPEGASALVYRDTGHAAELAARQGIRAADLAAVGLVDHVIPETSEDPGELCRHLAHALRQALEDLASQDDDARLADRLRRYRHLGLPAGDQPLPELAPGVAARRPRRSADLVEAPWVGVQAPLPPRLDRPVEVVRAPVYHLGWGWAPSECRVLKDMQPYRPTWEAWMEKDPPPTWSTEQKAAGDQMRDAWEEFFRATPARKTDEPLGGHDARLLNVRARHEADLMRYPNVVGVADGVRMRGGKPTGERAIVVYVERKVPRQDLAERDLLPSEIEGIPVDVVEAGPIVALGKLTSLEGEDRWTDS